jgi:hypothetical protein
MLLYNVIYCIIGFIFPFVNVKLCAAKFNILQHFFK